MSHNKIVLLLIVLQSLFLTQSCGKGGESVEIGSPTYSTPTAPFRPQREEDDTVTISGISKGDPCFPYVNHLIVKPVATCTEVANGRLKKSYNHEVKSARVCLLRKDFPNGIDLYTAIGSLKETRKNNGLVDYRLDAFGQGNIDNDLIRFEMKGERISYLKYNLHEDSITVRQVSKVWRKRVRYFRLNCKPVGKIVD